jgi:integrase
VAYYRRDGQRQRLRTPDGGAVDPADSAALLAAWQAAHQRHEAADRAAAEARDARTVRPRSIADLIAHYRASPEWYEKAAETKRDYEKALKPLEADFGQRLVAGIARRHVTGLRDRYAWREVPTPGKPGETTRVSNARQANRVVTVLSILLTFSIDPLGWRDDNPALRPRRLRTDGEGYRAWMPDEFRQFWEKSNEEWRFRALLALLSAQRGQDQVKMTWTDYNGQELFVKQLKGRLKVKLWVACHPALRASLDARRAALRGGTVEPLIIDRRPIMPQADGSPWPVNKFQKAAGVAIREAGLEGVVWHGLRTSAATWAADGGASDKALQAMLGHSTPAMTSRYSRSADQRRLAGSAVAAIVLPIGNVPETPIAKHKGARTAKHRGNGA